MFSKFKVNFDDKKVMTNWNNTDPQNVTDIWYCIHVTDYLILIVQG